MRLLLIGALALALGTHDAGAQANRTPAPAPQPKASPARSPVAAAQRPRGAAQMLRANFNVPPPGEGRFVPNEVILDTPPTVPLQDLEAIARRHNMTRLETRTFRLTGR